MNNILFVGEHSRTFEVQWHCHNEWELVYCTGGTGTFHFESGSTIEYREGQVVAIPPYERHANYSREGFTNLHIRLQEPAFPYHTAFRVEDDAEGHLKNAFTEARYYLLADIQKRELVMAALGDLICSYMIVYRSNNEFSKPVEQIRSLIINNYSHCEFALDESIRAMPFHYDYLRKLFKKEMGTTPQLYLLNVRLEFAADLLHGSDLSVAEVAATSGFNSTAYFIKQFKNKYGTTPKKYARDMNFFSMPQQ
jgi:AraC-like DNA-binding protein